MRMFMRTMVFVMAFIGIISVSVHAESKKELKRKAAPKEKVEATKSETSKSGSNVDQILCQPPIAIFKTILSAYDRGMLPRKIVVSEQHPIIIEFVESNESEELSVTNGNYVVNAKVDIARKGDVVMKPAQDNLPSTGYVASNGMWYIESGAHTCSGKFKVNGKEVVFHNGKARITTSDLKVIFEDDTRASYDDMDFIFKGGKWQQVTKSASKIGSTP